MIVKINTGKSFKGAALYQLHDKRKEGEAVRLTTERVAWTHTLNCLEDDPEHAINEMVMTHKGRHMLKRLSGNRPDGRPVKDTVMTVALAWSPEEKPSQAQMIEAAHGFLKHMGWSELQALCVAHNDRDHRHLHLIINRVHPDTGMTQDVAWMKHRSGQWALAYEREQGKILCPAREAKYGNEGNMTRREWATWQHISRDAMVADRGEHAAALQAGEWDALKGAQQDERRAFWEQNGELRKAIRGEVARAVKTEFAAEWKQYAETRDAKLKDARAYDLEAQRAVRHLSRLHQVRAGVAEQRTRAGGEASRQFRGMDGIKSIQEVRERQAEYHEALRAELKAVREGISERQHERTAELAKERLAQFGKERAEAYTHLKASHRDEKVALHRDQAAGTRRPDLLARQHEAARQVGKQQPEAAAPKMREAPAHKKPERQKGARDQLQSAARTSTADRPETGRLSETSPVVPAARLADAAREVTDAKARRQNEDSRPKSDREAMREAIRANYRGERGNRGRGDDDDGGRER